MQSTRAGFTLIELTIVFVIIGFLIGGVLLGRTIIHNAELQTIISDVERFKNAIKLFNDKYKALPGDMPNATSFWGTDPSGGSCPSINANNIPKVATCDGDGNTRIGSSSATPESALAAAGYYETMRAWQHLSNAVLIEDAFTGVPHPTTSNLYPGMNIPTSKIKSTGYSIRYALPGSSTNTWNANYNHIIMYGRPGSNITFPTNGYALKTIDALHIDTKADDGKPGTGGVLSSAHSVGCVAPPGGAGTESTSVYSSQAGYQCALIFITGF